MAKIFDISNGEVILTPEALAIPVFKEIWDSDKTKTKERAEKEIKFVVFFCDSVKSPYKDYPTDERYDILREEIFGDSKWKPDELVKRAIGVYEDLTETTSSRLLRSAKSATEKLAKYFEEVDFSKLDNQGKPIYSARELSSNLGNVGNIVKSLLTLETAVKKEQMESSRIRGGSDVNYFEDPGNL